MTAILSQVKTGQVTFAIKDTTIEGVEVKKDEFIGISGKTILCSNPDKVKTAIETIESMIDDLTSIVTIIVGENVENSEVDEVVSVLKDKYEDIEFDVKNGEQPVYSFIIGVE